MKTTIKIQTDRRGEELSVDADVVGGLAFHRSVASGYRGKRWQITHVASGLGLGEPFKLKATAQRVRDHLLELGDWTLPQKELDKWLVRGPGFMQGREIIRKGHEQEGTVG